MQCLRTLHIVWSLVRRQVTRCLTRLQTMYTYIVLRYRKIWWITSQFKFTGTGAEPDNNQKNCQFVNVQYCNTAIWFWYWVSIVFFINFKCSKASFKIYIKNRLRHKYFLPQHLLLLDRIEKKVFWAMIWQKFGRVGSSFSFTKLF